MFFRVIVLLALFSALSQNHVSAAEYRSCSASEIGRNAGGAGGAATAAGILATTPLCVASGPFAPLCIGAVVATGALIGSTAGHAIGSSIDGCR